MGTGESVLIARLDYTKGFSGVKWCPTPSIQFWWWTWVDLLLGSPWAILILYSKWVSAQPYKPSCFVVTNLFIVPWCFGQPFFPMFSFSLYFIKMSEWKHLIKILQHLHIYTEFCLLCQVLLILGGLNSLTCLHWGLAEARPFPGVFAKVSR